MNYTTDTRRLHLRCLIGCNAKPYEAHKELMFRKASDDLRFVSSVVRQGSDWGHERLYAS